MAIFGRQPQYVVALWTVGKMDQDQAAPCDEGRSPSAICVTCAVPPPSSDHADVGPDAYHRTPPSVADNQRAGLRVRHHRMRFANEGAMRSGRRRQKAPALPRSHLRSSDRSRQLRTPPAIRPSWVPDASCPCNQPIVRTTHHQLPSNAAKRLSMALRMGPGRTCPSSNPCSSARSTSPMSTSGRLAKRRRLRVAM